jgi:hypothetical protein
MTTESLMIKEVAACYIHARRRGYTAEESATFCRNGYACSQALLEYGYTPDLVTLGIAQGRRHDSD